MAGSHVLWPRPVVRTAIHGLRLLAARTDWKQAETEFKNEIELNLDAMHKLPLLLLAFREASIAQMGIDEVPDRWLECVDFAIGVSVQSIPGIDEAVLCALVEGVARQLDRALWRHLDPLLEEFQTRGHSDGWSRSMMNALGELRASMFGASCSFERRMRVRVRELCAEFAGPGVVPSDADQTLSIDNSPLRKAGLRNVLTRDTNHAHSARCAHELLGSLGKERARAIAKRAFKIFMRSPNGQLEYDSLIDYAWLADLVDDHELYGLMAATTSRCFSDLLAVPEAKRLGKCCALILAHAEYDSWQGTLESIARHVDSVEIVNYLRDLRLS